MGNSLYAARQTGLCPACRYDLDSVMHYRLHVPRDRWPESMRKGAPRVEHGPYARASAAPDMAVSGEAPAPASTVLADVAGAGTASSPEAAFDAISAFGQALIEANERDTCPVCGLRTIGGNVDECDHVDSFGIKAFFVPCECGWRIPEDSRNPEAAMRLHRAKAKQHREVTNGA